MVFLDIQRTGELHHYLAYNANLKTIFFTIQIVAALSINPFIALIIMHLAIPIYRKFLILLLTIFILKELDI